MGDVQETASAIARTIRLSLLAAKPGRPEPTAEEILVVLRDPELGPDNRIARAVAEYLATGRDQRILFASWVMGDEDGGTKALAPRPHDQA
jgi:hypothetical protein